MSLTPNVIFCPTNIISLLKLEGKKNNKNVGFPRTNKCRNLPAVWEPGFDHGLGRSPAGGGHVSACSNILAWRIPQAEEQRLESPWLQRVEHDQNETAACAVNNVASQLIRQMFASLLWTVLTQRASQHVAHCSTMWLTLCVMELKFIFPTAQGLPSNMHMGSVVFLLGRVSLELTMVQQECWWYVLDLCLYC